MRVEPLDLDLRQGREQGQPEQLGHGGRHAAGLAVGGPAAEEHEVALQGLEGLGQDVGRALRVGAGQSGVAHQHGAVGPHGQGLADGVVGFLRPHAQHGDFAPWASLSAALPPPRIRRTG